jgi:cyclic pyranopterin phosphate synthase
MGDSQHDEANPSGLTHIDAQGRLSMVDVQGKPATARVAIARALLRTTPATRDAILGGTLDKGEALAAARTAGILAAKRTDELIPLCHPLGLSFVGVDFTATDDGISIQAEARCHGQTGIEMEALCAASLAGLTLYDMAKAKERGMVLEGVRLVYKAGGKTGTWTREGEAGLPT